MKIGQQWLRQHGLWLWAGLVFLLYLVLASYQLGLPGLHYDEAREAGLNALELLTGAPVTAFRHSTLPLGGLQLPLMVQDYIGALNVYLALPFLWATGIGVPNLRIVALLTGLATLLLAERAVTAWVALVQNKPVSTRPLPLSLPGLLTITLLAASPSFVFWSRQGIFVTNLTQPLVFWSIWQGLRWLHSGRRSALLWSAWAGGCALYAKLLAFWLVLPFALLAGGWWLWCRWRGRPTAPLTLPLLLGAVGAFLVPLLPFFVFNWQSGGTWQALAGNFGTSYYGVENGALAANFVVRSQQLLQVLQGSHLWYLGALQANLLAPWAALLFLASGLWRRSALLWAPLLLLLMAFLCSLFTISALFITHYALLQPLLGAVLALALTAALTPARGNPAPGWHYGRWLLVGVTVLWLLCDLNATVRYHRALGQSGGLGDHSDASYHLAYHLRYNGLGAPIALDWGFDATVRYLSEGSVTPIEIFGYASPAAPDPAFAQRLQLFLGNPDNVYLLHTAAATTFQGRREQFMAAVQQAGRQAQHEATFTQRDGTPLIELWRVRTP
ncbi:MAG: hypothetical protein KF832_04970 [Caldilineaceae bacterium]|nr:hypothetical protein [Caldilineaceae bacterium]